MATNIEEAEEQTSKEILDIITEFNTGGGFNENILTILKKIRDDVKEMGARQNLDNLLQDININLEKMKIHRTEMNAGYLSINTAGDCMVRAGKMVKTLPGQLLYTQEDTKVPKGKLVSQYDLDGMHLSAEPDECHTALSEIRDLIIRCSKIHTELYLMGQQFDSFYENIQLITRNIPILADEKQTNKEIAISSALLNSMTDHRAGLIIGGMGGLLVGGVISGYLLNHLTCTTCLKAIGNALLRKGCTSCAFKSVGALAVSGFAFALCVFVGILADIAWDRGSDRRKVFENLHQFRKELETENIKANLTTMCQKLETVKEGLKADLNDTSNGSINILGFNIIMKAYKDYRRTYKEARADPENGDESDEQLHKLIRKYGAASCVAPLTDRFNDLSKTEAWELLDAIHEMVIGKRKK